MRSALLLVLSSALMLAQGTETKRKASEFPVQVKAGSLEIGADFMVRLISYGRESFVSDNFLVVEVALYPEPGTQFEVKLADWTMRVNGKKETLFAQTPQTVSQFLQYPRWEQPPIAQGGSPADIGERFPGDPRARRYPMPRVPTQPDSGTQPEETKRLSAAEVVAKAALPEGARKTAVSGLLYFPWKGNPMKLKSVELFTTAGSGDPVTIRLR